jgi:ferric-dicitrate binding protein FerR (iron transport regulator)
METPFDVEDIIANAFSGCATDEELADLRRWLAESEANRQSYDAYLNAWILSKAPFVRDRYASDSGWKVLMKRKAEGQARMPVRNFVRAAAIFIIVLGITGGVLIKNGVLNLSSSYITYVAPADSVLQITLPDLSQVWLNEGSSLRFPDSYNTKNRNVYLEGEGFFEVAKNEELPFAVHAGSVQIRVTGTSFHVNACPESPGLVATLVQGEISVLMDRHNTLSLRPGQQLVYRKEDKSYAVEQNVNTDLLTVWMRELYKFEDKSFAEIAAYLEKIYSVRIVFEDAELREVSFSGSFLRKQKLETTLELLQGVRMFQYHVQDQTIVIRK